MNGMQIQLQLQQIQFYNKYSDLPFPGVQVLIILRS
jgi:hypothetical protein